MPLHRMVAPVALALLAGAPIRQAPAPASELPRSALAVEVAGAWREWWRSDRAPSRWPAPDHAVLAALRWQRVQPGLDRAELRLAGSGEAWRLRVIVARVDPARHRLELHAALRDDGRAGPWTVDAAPGDAALAVNAGQFASSGGPWGWLVHEGREIRPPGMGALASAVVVDSAGGVSIVSADAIAAERASGRAVEAFQSYPAVLLGDGDVPRQLAHAGRGVDLAHRDARLAIGVLRDGRVVVVLTRFEGLGGALDALPFGPTTPEMAALMGALGCRRAVLLDGGISGQLMLRTPDGERLAWRGLRKVAVGFVAIPRRGIAARDAHTPR